MVTWNKITDDMPLEDTQCLVIKNGSKYIECLLWNSHYNSWDDIDGDDYCCDKDKIAFWMPFPFIPDELIKGIV